MTTANDWMRELEAELSRADGALLQSVREKVLGSPEDEQEAREVLVEVQGIKTNVVKVARGKPSALLVRCRVVAIRVTGLMWGWPQS